MIITKRIVAAYAEAILDIMEHYPSKENTKNIFETLKDIYEQWDSRPDYDEATDLDMSAVLDHLSETARIYVENEDYLDFDCDEMVYGLFSIIGKQPK